MLPILIDGEKNPNIMFSNICTREDIGNFKCSVGSTDVGKGEYLQENSSK